MKKVLITGGTRGIGKGIALAFQKKNYDVYAVYEKNAFAAAELEKLGIKTLCADVSKEEDVKRVFSIVGDVDILVNNAGVSLIKQVQDVTYKEWQRVFSVNVGGAFLCAREAVKGMISKKKRTYRQYLFRLGGSGRKLRKRLRFVQSGFARLYEIARQRTWLFWDSCKYRFAGRY